ncbi:flippase [Vibrio cholerae]|uniref:flippase n=1 Tax=Vibrio cholerae TaxID=666 RepID=UPI0039675D80
MLRNISWYGLDKLLKMLSLLATSIVVSRVVGIDDYGVYSYFIALNTLIIPLVLLGLDDYCYQKFASRKRKKNKVIIGNVNAIRLMANGGVIVLLILLTPFINHNSFVILFVLGLGNFSSVFTIYQYWNSANCENKVNAISSIISTFLFVIVKVFILLSGLEYTVFQMILLYTVEVCISAIVNFSLSKIQFNFMFNWRIIRILLYKAMPMTVSGVAIVAYYKMDQIMLGTMSSYRDVSVYAVQAQLLMAVNLLLQILINGSFPQWFNKRKLDYCIIGALSRFLFLVSSILWILTFFISQPVIEFLWGEDFSDVTFLLLITIIGTLFSGFGAIGAKILTFENLQNYRMKRVLIAMVINFIMNLMLIPVYGYYGAAIATVFSQLYSGLIGNFFSRKTRWLVLRQFSFFSYSSWSIRDINKIFKI